MKARLTFHGAAGEVTGSCYLLEVERGTVLVDCGMFQGNKDARVRNFAGFPFKARDVHAVVLTHAHIDHTGMLPRLVGDGYPGAIHATEGTLGLCKIMLPDSAHIQEYDAERRSKYRKRRGDSPVEPLYKEKDAERALSAFRPHPFDEWFHVVDGVRARYLRAGHILGAASIEMELTDGDKPFRLVFSGDVGPMNDPLLPDPESPAEADFLLLESTYGNRDHRPLSETLDELAEVLESADRAGGNVIVPVFAVGRAQMLIWAIGKLEREGRAKPRPVYLDSPMAIDVTKEYRDLRSCCRRGGEEEFERINARDLRFSKSVQDSIAINDARNSIILSASGMCEAGRILHHLAHHIGREETHLVFAGYQAAHTLGRRLIEGEKQVRIMGREVEARASIHTLGGFSAHAGRTGLIDWYGAIGRKPPRMALVHGEDAPRAALASALEAQHGAKVLQPQRGDVLELGNES
ncbi:MAG: MBL fold metallo-hydrolase [Planctomycetota bacterium]|nr:MBL fold metallo-hydrolase [Planctomycetota bacterium]